MKDETMKLAVKSEAGLILHELGLPVGKRIELKIDAGERFLVDGCQAMKGPGLVRIENRGESGLHLHVEKGGAS